MKWSDVLGSFFKKEDGEPITLDENRTLNLPSIMVSLIQNFHDPVLLFDYKGDVITYNKKLTQFIGTTKQDSLVLHQTFTQLFRHFDFETIDQTEPQRTEDSLFLSNRNVPVMITHIPLFKRDDFLGSFCIIQPCHSKPNQRTDLGEYENYFKEIYNKLDIALWVVDPIKEKVLFVSDAIHKIYGIPAEEIKPDTWKQVIHPEDIEDVLKRQEKLFTDNKIIHTYRIITPKNEIKWVQDHTITIRDEKGEAVRILGYLKDVTNQKELHFKLHQKAYLDELTQLSNRQKFREMLERIIKDFQKDSKTFAVFFINIDGLYSINQTFDYEFGDRIVQKTAQQISEALQTKGNLYHAVGDSFLVFVDGHDSINYSRLAEKLLHQFDEGLIVDEYVLQISISIGISIFDPNQPVGATQLIKEAERALSRAKTHGKGNYQLFNESTKDIESFRSFQLENDLRKALDKNELYLEYQPKVSLTTEKATGAEALLRWHHSTWGNISPAEFIPISENSPIIDKISDFVIDEVCKQTAVWEKEGIPFDNVSFNLSPINFYKRDLVERIKTSITKYQVTPTLLKIEITEGVLLRNSSVVLNHLSQLNEIGMKISLDDYGTGYSSLHYLSDYPVNVIKIDRSFIENMVENKKDAVIIQSVIDLAKGLNKTVVAEGVENRNQLNLLKKMGCHEVQGYLYSKPVSSEKMKEIFCLERVQQNDDAIVENAERREYYRINFALPLSTEMTILSIHDKEITVGSTEILVEDIGLGGLRFVSHLRLVPRENIVYGFQTTLMETKIHLNGKIVWGHEKSLDIFEYGVEFFIDEDDRTNLAALLNKVSPKLRSNPLFSNGNFINQKASSYIKEHFLKEGQ